MYLVQTQFERTASTTIYPFASVSIFSVYVAEPPTKYHERTEGSTEIDFTQATHITC